MVKITRRFNSLSGVTECEAFINLQFVIEVILNKEIRKLEPLTTSAYIWINSMQSSSFTSETAKTIIGTLIETDNVSAQRILEAMGVQPYEM